MKLLEMLAAISLCVKDDEFRGNEINIGIVRTRRDTDYSQASQRDQVIREQRLFPHPCKPLTN